jgi:hypothetical protein
MATSFINVTSTDVGTADAVVYTVPAGLKAILIGCNVANKSGGILPVSLILRKAAGDVYISKDKRIANGESDELMKGNKLVMLAGDSLVAKGAVVNGFDVIASILTGVT